MEESSGEPVSIYKRTAFAQTPADEDSGTI